MKTLVEYITIHRDWSKRTFGGDPRQSGLLQHIEKEIAEVKAAPTSDQALGEWVDIIILAIDGAWRCGHTPFAVAQALLNKQSINMARRWPALTMQEPDKPTEHVRDEESAA